MSLADIPDAGIPPAEVERRLEELRALHRFGLALLRSRFVDGASEVRDGVAPEGSSFGAPSEAGPRVAEAPPTSDPEQ